jgi:TonB family protein
MQEGRRFPIYLAASIIINVGLVIVVGNSDIFQHADMIRDLKTREIKVYKPPIQEKRKPKPKPPPPPPPPKAVPPPPTAKPITNTPPPPRPVQQVQQPTPQVPQPPQPAVPVSTGSVSTQGTVSAPPSTGQVGTPAPPPEPTPAPPPPKPEPEPTPPPPAPKPEPPPAPKPEPPPPPPPPKRTDLASGATPEPRGAWHDINMPDSVDLSTLSSNEIQVIFSVDTDGKPFKIRIKKSSGSGDLDNAAIAAISGMRFKAAQQGGDPIVATMTHTWKL